MIRVLTGSGLTANTVLNPAVGYKWIMQYVLVTLATSSTAGTRSVVAVVANSEGSFFTQLAYTGAVSGVSTDYHSTGSPSTGYNSTDQLHDVYESNILVSGKLNVTLSGTLISGDTYGYTVIVDEVLND